MPRLRTSNWRLFSTDQVETQIGSSAAIQPLPAPASLGRSADGQTDKVRLIVVDALEIIERRKHAEYYGRDASRFTTDLLKGKHVRL